MDGAGDDRIGWMVDGVAAGLLGLAIGTCLHLLGWPQAGVATASATVPLALALLRRVKPAPERFRLPQFTLPEADIQVSLQDPQLDELLLDTPLEAPGEDSRVVQLFAPRDAFNPSELRERIEAHLAASRPKPDSATVLELQVDAAAALREALGELRRGLA